MVRGMALVGLHSVSEFARRSGVTRNTFYQWWSGRTTPDANNLMRAAEVLGVGLSDLWAAWEGRALRPVTLEEKLDRAAELAEGTNARLDLMIRKLNAIASQAIGEEVRRAVESMGEEGLDEAASPPPGGRPARTRPKDRT